MNLSGVLVLIALIFAALELFVPLAGTTVNKNVTRHGVFLSIAVILIAVALLKGPITT